MTHGELPRIAACVTALCAAGCVAPEFPPADFAAPGWTVTERAALWRPSRGRPELTGELLVAERGGRELFVQFSKQGLPLVTARRGPPGWALSSPLRRGGVGGRGAPPASAPWFHPGSAAPPWTTRTNADGSWRMENARSGERLEVVP
jgi:hypothetical protein